MENDQIIIIGAGPAGVACAIQLKRYGYQPLIIEKNSIGGLLHEASVIENYPGFAPGIESEKLISNLKDHLETYDIKVIYELVKQISQDGHNFHIRTDTSEYTGRKLIIATGTVPFKPSVKVNSPAARNNILYGIREIRSEQGLDIGIIGAGDASFDYALSLSRNNKIHIFNRGKEIKALPLLNERVKETDSITYHPDYKLIEIMWNIERNQLECHFNVDNSMLSHFCDYIIFATGRNPALDFLSPTLKSSMNELQKEGRLFLIGDVRGDRFRQTAIATGEGIRAAMEIADESTQ